MAKVIDRQRILMAVGRQRQHLRSIAEIEVVLGMFGVSMAIIGGDAVHTRLAVILPTAVGDDHRDIHFY
ncbi:hypothetical protein D3C75_995140 [compost metagenome]